MKITRLYVAFLISFIFVTFAAIAQTNELAFSTEAPGNPILNLLTAKYGWLATLVTWATTIRVCIIPIFSVKLRIFLFDKMNEIAAANDQDDDAYLTALFSAKWYKLTAFILRFIGVTLPTMADLTRALEMQKQAVAAATQGK